MTTKKAREWWVIINGETMLHAFGDAKLAKEHRDWAKRYYPGQEKLKIIKVREVKK